MASRSVTVNTSLTRDDGTSVCLIVECSISGRYWAGNYENPPEYPEVEALSAKLEESVDLAGEPTRFDPPVDFDLDKLSEAEHERLNEDVSPKALEEADERDAAAQEEAAERLGDIQRERDDY